MLRVLAVFWLACLLIAGRTMAEPLPVDQALVLAVEGRQGERVEVRIDVAPGHYLYRDRLGLVVEPAGLPLAEATWPEGEWKDDPAFGRVLTLRDAVASKVDTDGLPSHWTLVVHYQGCADAGLCYPPQERRFSVTPQGVSAATGGLAERLGVRAVPAALFGEDESSRIARGMSENTLLLTLLGFFAAGLLLALTPCVLPMVPILSGIIVGQGQPVDRRRAFLLSVAYVLGMALTYAAAGVAAGMSGVLLSSVLQHPLVLGTFALLFVGLALSMFGLFDLQLPSGLQNWAARLSNRLPGGRFTGAGLMGALSALIVGPCIAPPLAGALLFISRSGDLVLGGLALFALAIGMGLPLLVVGTSAGAVLSGAAGWYNRIRIVFGVLLLALAVWILQPIWQPAWDRWSRSTTQVEQGVRFQPVTDLAAFRVALEGRGGRPVMLDFTADWCSTCRELERHTFSDASVAEALSDWLVLKADVTSSSAANRELLAHLGLFGPPAVLFFGADGAERQGERVLNFQPPERFIATIRNVAEQP